MGEMREIGGEMGESSGEMGEIAGEIGGVVGGEIGGEIWWRDSVEIAVEREMGDDANDFEKRNSTFPTPNRGSPRNVICAAKDALVKHLN
ncbi:hypothetical protein Bca101_013122 [Brassica carinata]